MVLSAYAAWFHWPNLVPLALAVTIMLALWGVQEMRARRAQSWPSAEGRVEVVSGPPMVDASQRHQLYQISYSFKVEGEYYAGSHVVPSAAHLQLFPVGSPVQVHYKASDPNVSFLDRNEVKNRARNRIYVARSR